MRLTIGALSVERGGFTVFEGVSFSAQAGEHVALVGPNGAGKTSLLRAIAGFLRPPAGMVAFDPDLGPEGLHFLGHQNALKPSLSVRSHLAFWRASLGGAGDVEAVLERVGLTRQAALPARTLSAGQSRRLALGRLLVAARPLWLLDEPAASLDLAGKTLLADLIAGHRAEGGLVVAAVHEPLGAPSQTVALGSGR